MSKFSRREFHDFYMASYLVPYLSTMRERETEEVLQTIETFSRKLLAITKEAFNGELAFIDKELGKEKKTKCVLGHDITMEEYNAFLNNRFGANAQSNIDMINSRWGSLKKFEEMRKANKIDLEDGVLLFSQMKWQSMFGGIPWAVIAGTGAMIQKRLPTTQRSVGDILVWTDKIIDLEHNTALYLAVYCDFDLKDFLEEKTTMTANDLMQAAPSLKGMYKKYSNMEGVGR